MLRFARPSGVSLHPRADARGITLRNKLFEELVALAKDLNSEEERAVLENLNEDELAIFDLLVKDTLKPEEIEQVKKTARELTEKLKHEKLVLDWREKESTKAGVKTAIYDVVYSGLPPKPTYTDEECERMGMEVYNFVYERYGNAYVAQKAREQLAYRTK